MACGTLIAHCIACSSSVSSARGVTLSTHVDEYIAAHGALSADAVAATTVREIVYGVQRCRALLSVTVEGLYARHVSDIARSDRSLYEIFTWLTVFSLKELGLDEFRRFVLSQEAHKMHTLLAFLFDPVTQHEWIEDQWSTVYDPTHVRDVLLGGMRAVEPQMTALISELAAKLTHTSSAVVEAGMAGVTKVARKESTVPEPFALTKPKVKMLPAPPITMTATYKASVIPEALYENSLKQVEEDALARRREVDAATAKKHAGAKPPTLSTHMRSQTLHTASERLRLELEAEQKAANEAFKPRPSPPVKPVPGPKLTTAAILREDLLYKRRLEEQAAAAAKFESELRDEEDFHRWQLKMEAEDHARKEAEIAARKIANAQAANDAVLALQLHAKTKHESVEQMREEGRAINAERDRQAQLAVEAKQKTVARITEAKSAIPLAVAEVTKKKVELAESIAASKSVHAAAKKAEAAAALVAKRALIKQIQAMEKLAAVRAKRPKEIDPTTTGGLGLLDEMSLVELQTRLKLAQEREAIYLAEKRARIAEDKTKKQEVLEAMQRNLVRMRGEMVKESVEKRLARTQRLEASEAKAAQKLAEESLILADRLAATQDQRRREALRLVAELKAKKIQNDFYTMAKGQLAAQRETDLNLARARVEATASVKEMEESKAAQIVKYEAEKNRQRVEKTKERARTAVHTRAEGVLRAHRIDAAEFDAAEALVKSVQRPEIASAVDAQIESHRSRNPYARRIAEREAHRAARLSAAASRTADLSNASIVDPSGDSDALAAEFEASQRMAEQEAQRAVEALRFGSSHSEDDDDDDEEEEEKQQPTRMPPPTAAAPLPARAAAAAAPASTPSSATLKRPTATAAAAKPVPKPKLVGGHSGAGAAPLKPLAARA